MRGSVTVSSFDQTPRRTVPAQIPRPDYAATGKPSRKTVCLCRVKGVVYDSCTGIPESERESKRANVMKVLNPAEIQGMRTACKVFI